VSLGRLQPKAWGQSYERRLPVLSLLIDLSLQVALVLGL
jgi:hypothetical protein